MAKKTKSTKNDNLLYVISYYSTYDKARQLCSCGQIQGYQKALNHAADYADRADYKKVQIHELGKGVTVTVERVITTK